VLQAAATGEVVLDEELGNLASQDVSKFHRITQRLQVGLPVWERCSKSCFCKCSVMLACCPNCSLLFQLHHSTLLFVSITQIVVGQSLPFPAAVKTYNRWIVDLSCVGVCG
jgi:hypothetical protein